jgi:hypothetical protein
MSNRCLTAVAAVLALVLISTSSAADLRPRVFAIRDARVVTEPGEVLPKATIVVRDGLIEAVGADVAAAAEASGRRLAPRRWRISHRKHWRRPSQTIARG